MIASPSSQPTPAQFFLGIEFSPEPSSTPVSCMNECRKMDSAELFKPLVGFFKHGLSYARAPELGDDRYVVDHSPCGSDLAADKMKQSGKNQPNFKKNRGKHRNGFWV